MNNAEFIALFRDPSTLMNADVQQLKDHVARFPYSANTHLALALWAELNDAPDREAYRASVASRTFDRGHLFERLTALTTAAETNAGEVLEESLELRSLEDLESSEFLPATPTQAGAALLEQQLAEPSVEAPELLTNQFAPQVPAQEPLAPEATPDTVDLQEAPADLPEAVGTSSDEENEKTVAVDPNLPQLTDATEASAFTPPADVVPVYNPELPAAAAPQDPRNFQPRQPIATKAALLDRLQRIRQQQDNTPESKDKSVKKIARRSLVQSDGMISATLAEVFISQGQYQHAIRIYEQLALANPEKSTIFAAFIKDLKRKL